MSDIGDGVETARGWKAKKYYLSDEAIALLVAHCKGTPLTMSAYLDGLIKHELDHPAVTEARSVIDEGRRQLEELTSEPAVPPMTHTDIRAEQIPGKTSPVVPQRRVRIEDQKPVHSKKDFDIDL